MSGRNPIPVPRRIGPDGEENVRAGEVARPAWRSRWNSATSAGRRTVTGVSYVPTNPTPALACVNRQ